MKFQITRTSCYGEQPCSEAVKESVPSYDDRTFKTFEEYDKKLGKFDGAWTAKGSNHEVTSWGIRRQLGRIDAWTIDFTTIEQLMKFVDKYGDCVVGDDWIEIYDGYRE